jgi:predicted DNA-binding transcriptional regulator AlpA
MVKQGKAPPHFRVGKTLRFRVTAIEKWMDEQERAS